jgi:hypothetical protein
MVHLNRLTHALQHVSASLTHAFQHDSAVSVSGLPSSDGEVRKLTPFYRNLRYVSICICVNISACLHQATTVGGETPSTVSPGVSLSPTNNVGFRYSRESQKLVQADDTESRVYPQPTKSKTLRKHTIPSLAYNSNRIYAKLAIVRFVKVFDFLGQGYPRASVTSLCIVCLYWFSILLKKLEN